MANEITDGNITWDGGMDLSRHPSSIGENQYRLGCNVYLPRSGGGISSRHGIHAIAIEHDDPCIKSIFETGNFQAEGFFTDGDATYLVCAISGYVFILTETYSETFTIRCVNENDQSNPDLLQGYFTTVPQGAIYNDGVSLPLWVTAKESRRSKPENNEITTGMFGVYVQNRFFYVTPDKREIKYSDFSNPISIGESIDANLPSFVPPENQDSITAIGSQKQMLQYAEGGTLVFSTTSNIYSVDIRGAAEDWEESATRVGKVQESVRGISACSANSFTNFNTNLYFRTRDFGICDLRQSQYQFAQNDDFTSQSIEVDALLEDDTTWMLNYAYTKTYNGRVYTTIAPQFSENGRVFWSGLIAYHPDPIYSGNQKSGRRFEGIITGVRPFALTSTQSSRNASNRLYIWSHDIDGIMRLYQMRKDSFMDRNHLGQSVRVRGFIETRGYAHKNPYLLKTPISRVMSLKDISTNLSISFKSKSEAQGKFVDVCTNEYLVETYKIGEDFAPLSGQKQQRVYRVLPDEPETQEAGTGGGNRYYYRTDRIEFSGDFTLDSFFRLATLELPDRTISGIETTPTFEDYIAPRMFTYNIASSPP